MKYKRGFVDGEYQDGEVRGLMFIGGKRGMGKTTEMERLLSSCSGAVLFFDTLSKHSFKGYALLHEPGEVKAAFRSQLFPRIIYQPRRGDLDTHFRAICRLVSAIGWMVFAVDELDKVCGVRYGDSRMCPEFYDIVNYGRHHRVATLATARIPVQVPRGFTSECGEMRLFRLTENRYVSYFSEFIGSDNAARLRSLGKFQFLLWRDGEDNPQLCGGRRR